MAANREKYSLETTPTGCRLQLLPRNRAQARTRRTQCWVISDARRACRIPGRRAMTRRPLANRRHAETFELTVAGLRYTCTVGRFPDGSIAELFLNNYKSNSAADTSA